MNILYSKSRTIAIKICLFYKKNGGCYTSRLIVAHSRAIEKRALVGAPYLGLIWFLRCAHIFFLHLRDWLLSAPARSCVGCASVCRCARRCGEDGFLGGVRSLFVVHRGDLGLGVFCDFAQPHIVRKACDKGISSAASFCAACTADAVDIIFVLFRNIIVEHRVDIGNVDASGGNVCRNEDIQSAFAEGVHDPFPRALPDIAMDTVRQVDGRVMRARTGGWNGEFGRTRRYATT